jgi:hypothetical protein
MVNVIRSRRFVLVPLTMLVTVSISGQNSEQKEEFDSGIVESVFRYQITKCAENTSLTVFLLSLHGKDPSDEFMKRFADDSVSVKRRSVLAKSEPTNEFIDKESGKFVALLSIDKLKFIDDGRAEVEGSCGYADWAARGYRYSLVREKNRWIVKRADSTWFW